MKPTQSNTQNQAPTYEGVTRQLIRFEDGLVSARDIARIFLMIDSINGPEEFNGMRFVAEGLVERLISLTEDMAELRDAMQASSGDAELPLAA